MPSTDWKGKKITYSPGFITAAIKPGISWNLAKCLIEKEGGKVDKIYKPGICDVCIDPPENTLNVAKILDEYRDVFRYVTPEELT